MNFRFWRNVGLIGLAHIALIGGLIRWNGATKNLNSQTVVWLNDSAAAPAANGATSPKSTHRAATVLEPTPTKTEDSEEEDHPVLTAAKSEIELPSATATPKPSPVVKTTPRPAPRPPRTPPPRPRPTPKPRPKKMVIAKASPRPTTTPTEDSDEEKDADAAEKKTVQEKPDADESAADKPVTKPVATENGAGEGNAADSQSHGGGSGNASEYGWYGNMLHDRLYSEWVQPTTTISSSSKISVLVRIRIEKDGRVSNFEIIRPSGNVIIDDSVAAISKHVRRVDPLPAGLGKRGRYDVKINFELNSEQ